MNIKELEFYALEKLARIGISQNDTQKAFKFCKLMREISKTFLPGNLFLTAKSNNLLAKIYEISGGNLHRQMLDGGGFDAFELKQKEIQFINYMDYSVKWVKKSIEQ
jgi:hypothetical protein